MALFFRPMGIFVEHPALAFVVTGGFAVLFLYSYVQRTRGATVNPWPLLLLAGVWGGYGVYERAMFAWSQTVTAPIRIDLFLIVPVLYVATLAGVIAWARSWRRKKSARGTPAVTAVAWIVVVWSGVDVLWNLFEFSIRMETYQYTTASDVSYWLRATSVIAGAVAFSAGYLIAGMRLLRHGPGAATLTCWLASASMLWTILKAALKLGGLGMFVVPIRGLGWGYAVVPLMWYAFLLWFFSRSSSRVYDAAGT